MNQRHASATAPPLLCPADLVAAPELASLALVEHALHTALLALVAAHPTLQELADPNEPLSLRRARRFVGATTTLHRVLDRYRAAVYDALQPTPVLPDDLPF